MKRHKWTTEEDQYLIESNATIPIEKQAAHLGFTVHSVYHRRKKLDQRGLLVLSDRVSKKPWTKNDHDRAVDMFTDGYSVVTVAKRLGRTINAVRVHFRPYGGFESLRHCGVYMIRNPNQVADLFGVARGTVLLWIKRKALKASKNIVNKKRKTNQVGYLVTDESLLTFIENRSYWVSWNPDLITDKDWKEYATDIRSQSGGIWLGTPEVADRLGYAIRTVSMWAKDGRFNEVRMLTHGRRYYFWSEDLKNFVPPLERAA